MRFAAPSAPTIWAPSRRPRADLGRRASPGSAPRPGSTPPWSSTRSWSGTTSRSSSAACVLGEAGARDLVRRRPSRPRCRSPRGSATSPPVALIPTTRPCLFACVPSAIATGQPVTRCVRLDAVARREDVRADVRCMRASVAIPPVGPMVMPASVRERRRSGARRCRGRRGPPGSVPVGGVARRAPDPSSTSKPSTDSPRCRVDAEPAHRVGDELAHVGVERASWALGAVDEHATSSPRRSSASAISIPM